MSIASPIYSESHVLGRIIAPQDSLMSPAAAQEVLTWTFSTEDQQRMSELAAKARHGSLSAEEKEEIEGFERLTCFLGIIKSKARRSLQQPPQHPAQQ